MKDVINISHESVAIVQPAINKAFRCMHFMSILFDSELSLRGVLRNLNISIFELEPKINKHEIDEKT